jgi:hypothetical protein
MFNRERSGILGRPVEPGDDGEVAAPLCNNALKYSFTRSRLAMTIMLFHPSFQPLHSRDN